MKASVHHRKMLLKQFRKRCAYCGNPITTGNMTLDHVFPKSRGGRRSENNIMPSCKLCNFVKADLSVNEFRKRIIEWRTDKQSLSRELLRKYPSKEVVFFFELLQREQKKTADIMDKLFSEISRNS